MGNNRYKLLIVEDDRSIRDFLQTLIQTAGYQALTAGSVAQGLLMCASHQPDLVVLDLGLPDGDGCQLIRQLRQTGSVPILVLSARTQESDKITALDLGANDYVTKPFGAGELLARVRAALRSSRGSILEPPQGSFCRGPLRLDHDSRQVFMEGEPVHLTQTEYNILELLARHAGRVMTYSAIIRQIWGTMDPGSVKKLQVNMANLRRKLGLRPGENRLIQNELGVGYRMEGEG